jgi:hypothetical protein
VTTLGLAETSAPKTEVSVSMRRGWLRHAGVAIGGASGAAVALGAYKVLGAQPDKAFALLQNWGPLFLLAMVALVVSSKFLDGLNSTVRESFSVVAAGVQNSAEAAGRTADALTRLADQGSRQAEQVERLAIYAAQEFPGVYERFDRQDEALRELAQSVQGLHGVLRREKAALDRREAHDGSGGT